MACHSRNLQRKDLKIVNIVNVESEELRSKHLKYFGGNQIFVFSKDSDLNRSQTQRQNEDNKTRSEMVVVSRRFERYHSCSQKRPGCVPKLYMTFKKGKWD